MGTLAITSSPRLPWTLDEIEQCQAWQVEASEYSQGLLPQSTASHFLMDNGFFHYIIRIKSIGSQFPLLVTIWLLGSAQQTYKWWTTLGGADPEGMLPGCLVTQFGICWGSTAKPLAAPWQGLWVGSRMVGRSGEKGWPTQSEPG